ncbi:hypothetical protein Q8W40_04340 [Vibrio penaeicida]|uniref:hypothetical protein n=1 Tax=Vibrio penaeicida TaxID=104609 RepID=UPI0027366B0F|nr:hypothetical protein [Vibrio penaeicida]MDP2571402.1 hypothetical protein [Vibrio penaeicida]
MHLEKAKKRIDKYVKKGFNGYPQITLTYYGMTKDCATEVVVQFTPSEGDSIQEERFSCETEIRNSELIQTTLVKIIDRTNAKSVLETQGVVAL